MKKTVLLLLAAMAAFGGCRKQITGYERPDYNPQPSLSAILCEGQPVWAQVSFAQGLDSVHPTACENAEVLLFVDGQFAERLPYEGDGLYVGQTIAEANHDFACKVVIPGFDTLFAQTRMPEKPVVTDVEIMDNATVDDEGRPCMAILITFRNTPEKRLFFIANMDAHIHMANGAGYIHYDDAVGSSINTDDPVLLNEGSDRLLFSNEIITDTSYTMKVNTSFSSHGWGGSQLGQTYIRTGYVVVRMHGLSESAYHYMKSRNAFDEPDAYTNLFLGVITPVNLYDNVENGLGVMAAIAPMTCDTVFLNPEN